jgi:hypothetical protein
MSTDREFAEKLKAFDQEWKEAQPAEEGSFDPIPPGNYDCIVVDAKLTESMSGNIGLNVQFEVLNGEYEGRYIYHTFWVTSKNIPYVKRDMGILGYSPNSAADLINAQRQIMSKKASLNVGQEEYDGRMRNKVRSFARIDNVTQQRELTDNKFQF